MALLLAYNKPICVCDQQFMHLYAGHFVNEMPRFRKTKKAENLLDRIMKDSEVTTWPLIKCKSVPCFLTGKDGTSQKEALSCSTEYHSIYAIFVGLIYLEISILHKKSVPSIFHIVDGFVVYFFINICTNIAARGALTCSIPPKSSRRSVTFCINLYKMIKYFFII